MSVDDEGNYLKRELYSLMREDDSVFEFLQAGSLDGVWFWDLENQTEEWISPRFWEVFGYDPETKKHLASEWRDIIHPDDLEIAAENLKAHLADRNKPYDQIVRYQHADGHWVWVRCRGLAIDAKDGKPKRMIGAHTDVTALKQREGELELALRNLRIAKGAIEEFASVASDDLRSPALAITQLSDILLQETKAKLSVDEHRMLELIRNRSRTLSEMLQGMLDYLTIAEKGQDVPPVPVSLKEACQIAGRLYLRETDQLDIGDDVKVVGDQHGIEAVVRNLVANAIKHHDGDSAHLSASFADRGSHVEFVLEDDGPGIDPRHREMVFSLFRTLHAKDKGKGHGLGLALVRRLMNDAKGTVVVEDKAGRGARFVVRWPKGHA